MKKEDIQLPVIVEKTLLSPNLSKKTSLNKSVNWVDQLCAVVNLIPVAGGALAAEIKAVTDTAANYKTSEFLRKFTAFIFALDELNDDERIEFVKEVEEKAQDASGNVMLNMVDSLDNINKQTILANLVKARGAKKISIEDFFRLHSALVRIPYVDLSLLAKYEEPYYDEDGDTELLFSTGVLRPAAFDSHEGDSYVLSPLGVKLVQFGMQAEVGVPLIKGASAGLEWREIGEDEISEMIDKTVDKREYEKSDRAMFDYDALRGK